MGTLQNQLQDRERCSPWTNQPGSGPRRPLCLPRGEHVCAENDGRFWAQFLWCRPASQHHLIPNLVLVPSVQGKAAPVLCFTLQRLWPCNGFVRACSYAYNLTAFYPRLPPSMAGQEVISESTATCLLPVPLAATKGNATVPSPAPTSNAQEFQLCLDTD